MGRRREDNLDDEDRTAARDFVMARLAAARGAVASAAHDLDAALFLFIATEEDKDGAARSELLEGIDEALGDAARAVQAAQAVFEDVDPEEEEPEIDEPSREDDDAEDERPRRRRTS